MRVRIILSKPKDTVGGNPVAAILPYPGLKAEPADALCCPHCGEPLNVEEITIDFDGDQPA